MAENQQRELKWLKVLSLSDAEPVLSLIFSAKPVLNLIFSAKPVLNLVFDAVPVLNLIFSAKPFLNRIIIFFSTEAVLIGSFMKERL